MGKIKKLIKILYCLCHVRIVFNNGFLNIERVDWICKIFGHDYNWTAIERMMHLDRPFCRRCEESRLS